MIFNKLKNINEIKDKCDQFLRKYPDSDNAEQVATLAGEVLVQSGDWKEVGSFYRGLETKFPKSDSLDRFIFFQGLAHFQDANFTESTPLFEQVPQEFPEQHAGRKRLLLRGDVEFPQQQIQGNPRRVQEYLKKFPDGRYAGDMRYRLSFIDFNDKDVDQSDKIIRDLGGFLAEHPDDAANGSMLCLMADTYKKKKAKTDEEAKATEDKALEAYNKAV